MSLQRVIIIFGCILYHHNSEAVWSCNDDMECSALSGSACNFGECVCPGGTQAVLGGTACVDVAPYYTSACYDDFQCSRLFTNYQCLRPENALPDEAGHCGCQPGHHYFMGRCWPSRAFGESCTRNEECMYRIRDPFNMMCDSGVCTCSNGYYLRQRGECRRSGLGVGDACVLDVDCQFEGGACDASSFTCVDTNESSRRNYNETEITVDMGIRHNFTRNVYRQPGALCNANNDCSDPFQCSSLGVCVCSNGYYPNLEGTSCLAELGSPVSSADECVGLFTEVRDGICSCQANFFFDEDMRTCVKVAIRITDFCFDDLSCHTFGAFARCGEPREWGLRSCECDLEETVWSSNRNMCMLFAGIGDQCEADSDCLAGDLEIQCSLDEAGEGVCSCPVGYQAIDGLCLTLGLELGDSCQVSLECEETANAECSGGRCSCSNGYEQLEDYCAPVIGGTCSMDSDCVISNTICSETSRTCQCGAGYVEASDVCWPVVSGFGANCNVTEQCAASMGMDSTCVGGTCLCEDGYHFRDGQCWPVTGLFEPCDRSSQCFLGPITYRVQCRNSLCQCDFNYPYSEALRTCTNSGASVFSNFFVLSIALCYLYINSIFKH